MNVKCLDHVNIRTLDVDAAAQFYTDLLGLERRDPPTLYPGENALWMHAEDGRAVLHLRTYACEPGSTGVIDHIAFDCTGKDEVMAKVKDMGLWFAENKGDGWSVIYTRDPQGVTLELYFPD